tara:strand:- start:4593 stop:4841 length:249 start_codon:yes stop_codon:yes gene_type:complete
MITLDTREHRSLRAETKAGHRLAGAAVTWKGGLYCVEGFENFDGDEYAVLVRLADVGREVARCVFAPMRELIFGSSREQLAA